MDIEFFDLVGVGFGPANLALAVMIEEKNLDLKHMFIESKQEFDWHPGMLIDDADMQISFLKDLSTMVNPKSQYTFLNYLKETSGLESFINLSNFHPTRVEYRNYLKWASGKIKSSVLYQSKVIDIAPVKDEHNRNVIGIKISYIADNDTLKVVYAKNIAIAVGGKPKINIPITGEITNNIIHSSRFLDATNNEFPDSNSEYRFAVVGSGQSSAEIFNYLYSNYKNSKVDLISTGMGFRPSDESEFVNEIFNGDFVNIFHSLDSEMRSEVLNRFSNTNYSVVDIDLIQAIYNDIYNSHRNGNGNINVKKLTKVTSIKGGKKIGLTSKNTVSGTTESDLYDGVFLGTGYDFNHGLDLIEKLDKYIERDVNLKYQVNRDYSLSTNEEFCPKIYLQGATEYSHGLSSILLSILPERAQDICNSLSVHTEVDFEKKELNYAN